MGLLQALEQEIRAWAIPSNQVPCTSINSDDLLPALMLDTQLETRMSYHCQEPCGGCTSATLDSSWSASAVEKHSGGLIFTTLRRGPSTASRTQRLAMLF